MVMIDPSIPVNSWGNMCFVNVFVLGLYLMPLISSILIFLARILFLKNFEIKDFIYGIIYFALWGPLIFALISVMSPLLQRLLFNESYDMQAFVIFFVALVFYFLFLSCFMVKIPKPDAGLVKKM